MDTVPKMSTDQADLLAKELIEREPRVRDSWLGQWARGWATRSRVGETRGHEFSPLSHPSSPRWSVYNSIFDHWHK